MATDNKYLIAVRKRLAGASYEAYIAELLRRDGWQVDENGRNARLDHGIDLIASKDGIKRYIQCKGWKRNKTIYENTITQLYGSVALFEGTENLEGIEKYLYTPAALDPMAQKEAEQLGIIYVRQDFPKGPTSQKQRNWYKPHKWHRSFTRRG